MESHHFFMGKLTISMAIFNSYVSLPEGILISDQRGPNAMNSGEPQDSNSRSAERPIFSVTGHG